MSSRAPAALLALLCLSAAGACQQDRVQGVVGDVRASPARVDFDDTYVGFPVERTLTLSNGSRAHRTVELKTTAPFRVDGEPMRRVAGGATLSVRLLFAPEAAADFEGVLEISAEGESASLPLSGSAQASPECTPTSPCRTSAFDPLTASCVETALSDGTACDPQNACLLNPRCAQGECTGESVSCDDGNACTTDACDPTQGCVSDEASNACPEPTAPCEVAFCDPASGCGITDAQDGTSCGPADCSSARICLGGACKTVAVPDGAPCGVSSPCRELGVCQDKACVQPAATMLMPVWTYPPLGMSIPARVQFFGAADPQDNVYWSECRSLACIGPGCPSFCDVVSAARDGSIRWRVEALPGQDLGSGEPTHQLVAGDRLITLVSGSVLEARRLTDGALLWNYDFTIDYWHSVYDTVEGAPVTGMRFGVPSADETKVVVPFEGWVKPASGQKLEKGFAVAFSLTDGAELWQVPVDGFSANTAIDEAGAVYIASTMYSPGQAPAHSLEAWTSQGGFRWRTSTTRSTAPTVADGTLYLGGLVAFETTTGDLRWSATGHAMPAILSNGSAWAYKSGGLPSDPPYVTRRTLSTGAEQWTTDLPGTVAPFGELALTETSSLLLLLQRFGSWPTSLTLEEVQPNGEPGFSCQLGAMDHVGGSVLLDGLWIGGTWLNQANRVMAFELPGIRAAKKGWVGPRGGRGRAGSAD